MIPTNSSGSTNGCDNISSNCVVWQGPDISCINLCSGDTISEVTYKLATKVCQLITDGVTSNPSLTGLDLTCLNIPGITPTTLVPVLQAMVTQICANTGSGQTPNASSNLSVSSQVQNDLPMMTLPACMQYNDASGNPVTSLRLDEFATLIANQVCTNLSSIQVINTTLTSYSSRLDILEACVLPCSSTVVEKQVVPTCIINVGTLTDVSVLLLALEVRYCALETAVGLPAAINLAIGQSAIASSTSSLYGVAGNQASYGSLSGWNGTVSNLAQSVQNAWVVIDDLYNALNQVQTTCCPSGCDGITYAYTTTNVFDSAGLIISLNFNFLGSVVPTGFSDSSGFSKLIVTDVAGVKAETTASVSALQNSSTGITLSLAGLNTAQNMTAQVQFAFTDGVSTCEDAISQSITGIVPCPASITTTGITTTGVTVGFTQLLGTSAVYVIDILNSSNVVVATFTQNSPTGTVSKAFTGLTPGSSYNVRVTTTYNGGSKVCDLVPFATTSAAAACSAGMDVAFVIDYSSSMGTSIDAIKTGIATVVNSVTSQVGSNVYRLGLVTADESTSATPTYNTSSDYVALPAAQRIINTGASTQQFITAWEVFQNNNTTTFQAQLNKLNSGNPTAGVPLGSGNGVAEPTDMAIGLIIESNAFLGTFTNSSAKYVVVVTDQLPSGSDDQFNDTDVARLNSLQATALSAGIKIMVCGPGTSVQYTPVGGTAYYPWRTLAVNTGGNWNVSESPATIASLITNGCS
tara:strand:+ start:862 stop:3108 length:2247 start_codon:yes stop_codon:yes gene_type:complete